MTYQFLKLAAASAIVAFTAVSMPAQANDTVQRLGPVGPHEPILTSFGNKRLVAFFIPDSGTCGVRAVVWNADDLDAKSASQFQVSLKPGQTTQLDSPDNKTLRLECGAYAQTLAVIDHGMQFASQ